MSKKEDVRLDFLHDVSKFKATVLLDQGLYRHLELRHPGTYNHGFDIITWPGSLIIHGDMGTYSFSRVEDMFSFFRCKDLSINEHYWEEKMTSVDVEGLSAGSSRCFDSDMFLKHVDEYVADWLSENHCSTETAASLKKTTQQAACNIRSENEAFDWLYNYSYETEGQIFSFDCPSEWTVTCHTYRFLWCLYAIVWGIQQYDARKKVSDENSN